MTRLLFVLILAVVSVAVDSQGQQCQTPNQEEGLCVPLPRCATLVNLYASDRSRNTINFLVASQRICGNKVSGRDPILCCTDGVVAATTPAPTQAPSESRAQGAGCISPDGLNGQCIGIKTCPAILKEFLARQKDPEYVRFIQKSNAICNYAQQNICCPNEAPVTEAPPPAPPTQAPSGLQSRLFTPEEGCGFSNETHNRVVGGVPARLGAWPWMALVGYKNSLGEISFKCGGTLITSRHVLTAAHCIRNDLFSVRLGEHDLSTTSETKTQDVLVSKIIPHPNYDKKDGHSDMAILVLDNAVAFTIRISPVCLPFVDPIRSKKFVGYLPFVAGWGRTQEGGKSANVLQELQIPVLKNQDCSTRYEKIGKLLSSKQFDNAVICAGILDGGKDTCQGDSGGPLMAPQTINGQSYFYQIGVVSYGVGCARAELPSVYTSVQYFVDWVQEIVANN